MQTDDWRSPFDRADLHAALQLSAIDAGRWRSVHQEPNSNGRVYGGQLLAHALLAAAGDVDAARQCSVLQLMFLQGADHRQPIDYRVTTLQEGKRFSSRHVRGAQGERIVCDAQVSFALPSPAPSHEAPAAATADPEASLPAGDIPPAWQTAIQATLGRRLLPGPALDIRLPEPPQGLRLAGPEPRLKMWVRVTAPLPQQAHLQSAAFAYVSDYWFNYAAVGAHVGDIPPGHCLYQASLNHALWLHRAVRTDEWLLFDITSPVALGGRGLVIARVHDRAGRLVASATQECFMALRQD